MNSGTATMNPFSTNFNKESMQWGNESKSRSNKKFDYQSRTNKIPLRDKLRQVEAEKAYEELDKEARRKANRMLAEKRRKEEEMKQSKKVNGILKNKQNQSDYVTLTQDQLEAILASLSQVQGSKKPSNVHVEIEPDHHLKLRLDQPMSSERQSRESYQSHNPSQQLQLESVLNLAKIVKTAGDTPDRKARLITSGQSSNRKKLLKPTAETLKKRGKREIILDFDLNERSYDSKRKPKSKSHSKDSQDKNIHQEESDEDAPVFSRQPHKVVVLEESPEVSELKLNTETNSRSEIENNPQLETVEAINMSRSVELTPRQKQLLLPKAHMTKAERKRLEWELENVEVEKLNKEKETQLNSFNANSRASNTKESTIRVEQNPQHNTLTVTNRQNNTKLTKQQAVGSRDKSTKLVVEPDYVPGLGDLYTQTQQQQKQSHQVKPLQTNHSENLYVDSQLAAHQATHIKETRQQSNYEPLSKVQLKRLQWEKEKAASLPDYNPWGRPAPGVAPGRSSEPPAASTGNQPPAFKNEHTQLKQQVYEPEYIPGLNITGHMSVEQKSTEPERGAPTRLLGLENKANLSLGSQANQQPMRQSFTKAELLRQKWAEERAAAPDDYNPFGKPGAGAPIRTDSGTVLTSYHSRLQHVQKKNEELGSPRNSHNQQAWSEVRHQPQSDHHKEPSSVPGLNLDLSYNRGLNSDLTNKQLPAFSHQNSEDDQPRNHLRGQMVNIDPITLKEREEQRRKELEHQEAIRKQVEEKQRLKHEEEQRKRKEEAELEEKYRQQVTSHQQQNHIVKEKHKEKEAKEMSRVDLVAEAMLKAQQEAELLKAKKRLDKLKAAGHDISHLLAAYEKKFTPRLGEDVTQYLSPRPGNNKASAALSPRVDNSVIEPNSVPGLDITPRGRVTKQEQRTPIKYAESPDGKENRSPMRDLGVQTDSLPSQRTSRSQRMQAKEQQENTKRNKQQIRVISGPKTRKQKKPQEAKPWGWKNQDGKKFTGQSKRDPYYDTKEEEKKERHLVRKEQMRKLSSKPPTGVQRKTNTFVVEANSRHIPDSKTRTRNERESRGPPSKAKHYNHPAASRVQDEDNTTAAAPVHTSKQAEGKLVKKEPLRPSPASRVSAPAAQDTNRNVLVSEVELDRNHLSEHQYMPLMRTDAVLSPTNAQDIPNVSREATHVALAREAYHKSMQPAQYGFHMQNIKDMTPAAVPANHNTMTLLQQQHDKDPLYNPSLVTKHPTDRQLQMLDSLKLMRQGLMAKKREFGYSPDMYSGSVPADEEHFTDMK